MLDNIDLLVKVNANTLIDVLRNCNIEYAKRALDNQKLEVVHENGNLVAQKTQEVVNKIFDVYCDEISGCTSEELDDLRRFIGVLPTNDKEISLIRIGHVKYNTVFGILVDIGVTLL